MVQPADIKHFALYYTPRSALVLARLGERDKAESRLREAEELIEQQLARGHSENLNSPRTTLSRAYLLLGHLEEAYRVATLALETSAGRRYLLPTLLLLLADIASHPDRFDRDQGESGYRKAMTAAEGAGQRPVLAHCHLGLGKLYRRMGKLDQAQEHLTTATTMYREMDMRFYLEQAEREVSQTS